ncbi:MAG: cellulase family glycosylhydrolase [Haliea sp.]|nr:cellulase family glycosylhydrolase [Haliea sp.]
MITNRPPAQVKPVVKTIMRDLKQRFPQIKYIEAFNEPDHNLAKALKPDALYDYYRVYYQAVNEINQELKPTIPLQVGGPGFMQYNEPWLRAFLDGYSADPAADKRLDFISWHAYGEFPEGDGGSDGPRAYHFYKGDPSEVAGQRAKLNAELRSRGLDENIPAFITESGIYPGPSFDHQNDPKPDYLIGAAGVPSLHYWYMEQDNIVPFNWVLRHKSEERKDQLVTRVGEGEPIPTGVFTPYGNALVMMSKLKDGRVAA